MCIRLVGETEVADVVRAVDGLSQRTQHHGLQELHVRPALDLLQQPGVVLGVGLVAAVQAETEFPE